MSISCEPFPNEEPCRTRARNKLGYIGTVFAAERLFNCCKEDFIQQYAPMMEKWSSNNELHFPSGFGVHKAQKLIEDHWDKMPAQAKKEFLTRQLAGAAQYTMACLRAMWLAEVITYEDWQDLVSLLWKDLLEAPAVLKVAKDTYTHQEAMRRWGEFASKQEDNKDTTTKKTKKKQPKRSSK